MTLETVEDAEDPRLEPYRDVKDPRLLRERGWFLAEGRLVIESLLRAPDFRVHSLLATEAALEHFRARADLPTARGPVYQVSREVMNVVSGLRFNQGCVAAGERIDTPPTRVFEQARRLVAIEQVSDPDNIGGIFRSAQAFGFGGVVLSPGCASPLYRKASRTSMGAAFRVPFRELPDWPADLAALRSAGHQLVGLTPDREAGAIDDFVPAGEKLTLIFGSEGYGLSRTVRERLDLELRIPMVPDFDSLNVATAAGIAMQRLGAVRN